MRTSVMADPVLEIRGLEAGYGKQQILRGIDLTVSTGEVVALLGANGAGKTTLLNTITGFIKPVTGEIVFAGRPIAGYAPHQTFALGIVQVSQERDLFPDMTVEENLRLGAAGATQVSDVDRELRSVFASFPRLLDRRRQRVRLLSGGEQQMVAIGRAVMGRPIILLLDEPSGGLSPRLVGEIGSIVERLKAAGTPMLLVEQHIGLARRVADRFLILRDGRVAGTMSADALANPHDEAVRQIYL